MGAIASQITNLTIVYSIVYSDADQRKHQSSASLIPGEFPAQMASCAEMFPFDDAIMKKQKTSSRRKFWRHRMPRRLYWLDDNYVMLTIPKHLMKRKLLDVYLIVIWISYDKSETTIKIMYSYHCIHTHLI